VNRGGSWNNNPDNARVANRNNNSPSNRNNNLGFRLSSTSQRPAKIGLWIVLLCQGFVHVLCACVIITK
jgi:hypothetical protein